MQVRQQELMVSLEVAGWLFGGFLGTQGFFWFLYLFLFFFCGGFVIPLDGSSSQCLYRWQFEHNFLVSFLLEISSIEYFRQVHGRPFTAFSNELVC